MEGRSAPWIPRVRVFEHKRSSSPGVHLVFPGTARGPIWLKLSSSFSKLPMQAVVSMNKLASLRTLICFFYFYISLWLKILTGGAPSRLFSLRFLFLVLKVPSSRNNDSALLCALQFIAGIQEMNHHVHWPNTGVQDLWLYKLRLMLLL